MDIINKAWLCNIGKNGTCSGKATWPDHRMSLGKTHLPNDKSQVN